MRFAKTLGALLIMIAFTVAGCGMFGGGEDDSMDKQKLEQRLAQIKKTGGGEKHTQIKMATAQEVLDEVGVTYSYDPINKPDPFRPYAPRQFRPTDTDNPLLKYEVRYFKLVGIIRSTDSPFAIFEDPSGRAYTVHVGDLIGKNGGHIRAIMEDAVVVEETRISWGGEGTETVEMTIRLRPQELTE